MLTSDRLPPIAAPGDDVAYLDAVALAEAFRRQSLSPVEVARALISRVEALGAPVNAIVYLDPVLTLAQAKAAEARYAAGRPLSPLDGIPVTIKDLSAVAGWPRRRGSLALDPVKPAAEDTPCVARLREAGCSSWVASSF